LDKKQKSLKDLLRTFSKVQGLPDTPGVYIFKDKEGNILYIGKAKSLRKRLYTYFRPVLSFKNQKLISKVKDIEYQITPSESQAQLLEASLIKKYQPPYNISLKDDKSFPLIRITHEEFPAIYICRKKKLAASDIALSRSYLEEADVYFGPYTNVKLLRQALKTIRKIFGFRSCKKMPKKPCLYFRLNLCPAPCAGKITAPDYQEIINHIKMFLSSKYEDLLNKLSLKMQALAEEKKFEEAAKIRDQIMALSVMNQITKPEINLIALEDLKRILKLEKLPQRIEAFDISNISGKLATGSMVSFYKGKPDKNNYRRFRIKTVEGINDYKMLEEIIYRRYQRLISENLPLPDLVLIDGGRAHLRVAKRVIEKLGIKIPLVSIAKDKENIYLEKRRIPIKLNIDTAGLNLIRQIRDEAHRFALKYHHLLRRKEIIDK